MTHRDPDPTPQETPSTASRPAPHPAPHHGSLDEDAFAPERLEDGTADLFADSCWAPADATSSVAPGLVDRVTEAVLADRREVAAEAAQVDAQPLPQALLNHYRIPEPPADFVDRTWARVRADRDDQAARDRRTLELLADYTAPEPNAEFVDRTLDALRVDRSPLRLVAATAAAPAVVAPRVATATPEPGAAGTQRSVHAQRPPAAAGRRPRRLAWSALALAATVVAALWVPDLVGERAAAERPSVVALEALRSTSAQEFSPAPLDTAFARLQADPVETLHFEPGDALLQLAVAQAEAGE